MEIFKKIKRDLDKTIKNNLAIHFELFFGSKDYPCWTGYTIGYYLVEDYLKQNKNISWKELLKREPSSFKKKWKNRFDN